MKDKLLDYAAALNTKADKLEADAIRGAQQPELYKELMYCLELRTMALELNGIAQENG